MKHAVFGIPVTLEKRILLAKRTKDPWSGLYSPTGGGLKKVEADYYENPEISLTRRSYTNGAYAPFRIGEEYPEVALIREVCEEIVSKENMEEYIAGGNIGHLTFIGHIYDKFKGDRWLLSMYAFFIREINWTLNPKEASDFAPLEFLEGKPTIDPEKILPIGHVSLYHLKRKIESEDPAFVKFNGVYIPDGLDPRRKDLELKYDHVPPGFEKP